MVIHKLCWPHCTGRLGDEGCAKLIGFPSQHDIGQPELACAQWWRTLLLNLFFKLLLEHVLL